MSAPGADAEIAHEETGGGGRWVLRDGGTQAVMTYTQPGADRIIVDHTLVPEEWRGRGLALALAERMVADARARGWSVVPACSYVRAKAGDRPDWSDVIEGVSSR